jgi:hypothetical protein
LVLAVGVAAQGHVCEINYGFLILVR